MKKPAGPAARTCPSTNTWCTSRRPSPRGRRSIERSWGFMGRRWLEPRGSWPSRSPRTGSRCGDRRTHGSRDDGRRDVRSRSGNGGRARAAENGAEGAKGGAARERDRHAEDDNAPQGAWRRSEMDWRGRNKTRGGLDEARSPVGTFLGDQGARNTTHTRMTSNCGRPSTLAAWRARATDLWARLTSCS